MRLLQYTFSLLCLAAAVLSPSKATAELSVVVSVPDQTLAVVDGGVVREKFSVSTSKFGLGDRSNSYATPLGSLEIASKIGGNARAGTVFKSRQPTGEILAPNAPGRDPIVTRILWLRGLEKENSRAYSRGIYIHGTPVEKLIGKPVSFGCIRMRSTDVMRLFNTVRVGTKIEITNTNLRGAIAQANVKQQMRGVRLAENSGPSNKRQSM
ncbi:MAG TPA: L,D-transpeptidase [Chthoniobacterales bacterium]|nr:L,D-transpeptidase [Chthoniobacterales bacterium]